jgi:hypothetical protein
MDNELPVVSKSPLTTIPQLEAFRIAGPLILIPEMAEAGVPNVYKQPFPPRFVATARAVIVSLFMDRTFMKYVGWTTATRAST